MLNFLNICSKSRKHWVFIIFSAISFEAIAFSLQYFLEIKPCVLCIYQRCALFGIIIAGFFAITHPSFMIIRIISILLWIYSAWKGLLFAKEHTNIQLHPSPFFKCDLFIKFPNWLPLNKWWPSMFEAYGDCTAYTWHFLSLEISQWTFIIFANYLILGSLILLAQFTNFNK